MSGTSNTPPTSPSELAKSLNEEYLKNRRPGSVAMDALVNDTDFITGFCGRDQIMLRPITGAVFTALK